MSVKNHPSRNLSWPSRVAWHDHATLLRTKKIFSEIYHSHALPSGITVTPPLSQFLVHVTHSMSVLPLFLSFSLFLPHNPLPLWPMREMLLNLREFLLS